MVDSNWSNWTHTGDRRSSSDGRLPRSRLSHLSRPDLDVEVVPLVGDLEDLWPGEPVDPQPVSVDQQAAAAHAQHDGHALRVLHTAQRHGLLLAGGGNLSWLEHASARWDVGQAEVPEQALQEPRVCSRRSAVVATETLARPRPLVLQGRVEVMGHVFGSWVDMETGTTDDGDDGAGTTS